MTTVAPKISSAPHGTQEWAASNVNIQDGCEHDCRYCYAKTMALRFRRTTATSWAEPSIRAHSLKKGFTHRAGRIMFPTAHDITPKNINECLTILERMLCAGNDVLIVSKPRTSCVNQLCEHLKPYSSQIVFRFSIGSANDAVLKYWEPGAPGFQERLACLQTAKLLEFATSVSCEPMLDDNIHAVISAVHKHVTDSIWIGKINRLRQILPFNCPGDAEALRRGAALTATQNDDAIRALYNHYKSDPKIKWKDSIKAVVGLARPQESGLDL